MTSSKNSLTNEKDTSLPYEERETDYTSVEHDKEDDEFNEYEYDNVTKPDRKPFYRRKKVIVTCAIGTVIFLAAFIPLFIFVILPKIAQLLLNSSSMELKQLNMTSPGETSMTVSMQAQVGGIPKIFSADLEFTQELQVSWNDKIIGSMNLDPVKVSGGKGDILQATSFAIEDKDAFASFVQAMMADDSFTWVLNSKATLKTLGQTIKNLDVKKELKMSGLSNFSNIKILKFDLPSDAPEGALVSISAAVANPSPIGINLGTITLDMSFQTAQLGRVVAKNCTLIGGQDMILNLEGTLVKQTDPVHLQELSLLMSNYLAGIVTMASAKGVSVFPDGVNEISYLTKAILATTMTVPLVSPAPLNVIQSLDIKDMGLTVTPETAWNPTAFSNAVVANFKLPFNISLNITELANATMTLIYKGTPLADLTTAVWNQTSSQMPNKIVFTLPPSPLNVKDNAHDAFQAFLTDVVQNADTGFDVKGSVDSVATTNLGVVRLKVQFTSTVALKGIAFATNSPSVSNATVIGGSTDHVTLSANVGINNPSIFTVDAGPVTLKISGSVSGMSGVMGEVQFAALKLAPGPNTLVAQVLFHPADPAFRDEFFSKFVAGSTFDCIISGMDNSTTISSMAPVLKTLVMNAKVPGLIPAPRIIPNANGAPNLGSVLGNRQIPLTVGVINPLQTILGVTKVYAEVYWRNNYFGTIESSTAFEVASAATATSPPLILQAPLDFSFGVFMVTTFLPANIGVLTGAIVNVDMVSKFGVSVGGPAGVGYGASIDYNQTALPAFLKLDLGFAQGLKKRAEDYGYTLPGAEPSVESGSEYIEWLKSSLFATHPEEARKYLEGQN